MILRNFVWQNVGDGKCSSEGKGPQKTGGQGRSEGKGPLFILDRTLSSCPGVCLTVGEVWPAGHHCLPLIGSRDVSRRVGLTLSPAPTSNGGF